MGCQPAMRKVKHEPSIDMAKQYYSSGSAFNSPTRHSSHCKDNVEEEQVIPVKKDAPTCLDRRVSLGTITEISGSMGSMIEPAKNFSRTNWYFLLVWLWNLCLMLQIGNDRIFCSKSQNAEFYFCSSLHKNLPVKREWLCRGWFETKMKRKANFQ